MKKAIDLIFFLFIISLSGYSQNRSFIEDSITIRSIYDEVLAEGEIYDNLRTLTKDIGHRLSGSYQAEQAMNWVQNF